MSMTRRQVLQASLAAPVLGAASTSAGEPPRRPRTAVVYTVCHHRSHAHVIPENLLTPYLFNSRLVDPTGEVASIWTDQRAAGNDGADLTDEITRRFKVPLFKTINDALTLGGKELAVDGVLSIGEHGAYPINKQGVREYPRKRFFD